MDYYEILGVPRKARPIEIKKAYRRLARKYHPDLNPGDKPAEERFKKITEAHETLSDPVKRKDYDLQTAFAGTPGPAPGSSPHFETVFDLGDLGGMGGMSSLFSEILGGRGAERQERDAPLRGDDVTHTLRLGFFDALRGLTTSLTIDAESSCPRCHGSGRVPSRARRPCPDCAGTGKISHVSGSLRFASACRRCQGEGVLGFEGCGACHGHGVLHRSETIRVHIPAGVDTGSRVRVAGKGHAGRNGGAPGDLTIVTQVEPHPFFQRIGDNIHCAVPITVTEAALGTRLDVPTIDGRAQIRIPPGTENGQKLRLRGKGVTSLRGTGRGDAYIEVRITTPPAGDERSRELLRELGTLNPGDAIRKDLFTSRP